MSIRVGTVVNIDNAYNSYKRQIKQLKEKKADAKNNGEKAYYDTQIRMTEMELNEFLQLIIPDPETSNISPYLAKGYDELYSNEHSLDVEA